LRERRTAPLPQLCGLVTGIPSRWQFIRDNWLSNRVFRSYDDILEHCCFASNKLVDQPGPLCRSDCGIGHSGSDQWDLV
jgi:hypothetical protein